MKKMISVSIPCRNEQDNVVELVEKIKKEFEDNLSEYDYQIQFSDNKSTDDTRRLLREICAKDPHVRAIFNVASFSGSAFHSILQTDGNCCIHMAADFQDPPELIPQLVRKWEEGAKVVCAIKTSSSENILMWKLRSLYYKIMVRCSTIQQIEHFTGFGLYDRAFVEIIRRLNDPIPTLRGVVAEYGYKVEKIKFNQPRRKKGKSSNNFMRLYDYAMRNFTTYTKIGMHIATLLGMVMGGVSFLCGLVYLVLKLAFWTRFSAGMAPVILGVFFIGGMQLFFIGLVGEYVLSANTRLLNRPLAVEEERVNFTKFDQPKPDCINPYWAYNVDNLTASEE